MRLATQQDLDAFFTSCLNNPEIYPYISITKYQKPWEISKDGWNDAWFCNNNATGVFHIIFDRIRDEATIGLWAHDVSSAASLLRGVDEFIKRYKPRAINSVVHASNIKSRYLHYKIFGNEWGIEPLSAWNTLLGKYEDAYYFRKLL